MTQHHIWSVVNQKGGVGKTTTAVNLSTAFAAMGQRVLLIDLDPQANATTSLGLSLEERQENIYDMLCNDQMKPDHFLKKTCIPGLDIVPGSPNLSGIDLEFYNHDKKHFILKKKLEPIQKSYDFIIMDCPPSLGFLTVNAMCASTGVVVPLQCEFFALEGLSQLLHTVETLQQNLNPDLKVEGIVLTMFDQRNKLSSQVSEDVRSYLGEVVLNTVIPRNIRLSEAPSYGKPALIYDLNCSGSQAYLRLAKEIKSRIDAQETLSVGQ